MKKLLPSLVIFWLPILIHAQNDAKANYDYHWVTGYDDFGPGFGGTKIDFSNMKPEFTHFPLPYHFGFDMPCSISDENGKLQFYSSGCSIYGADDKLIENGDDLAPGYFQSIECDQPSYGYDSYQDMMILPWPGQEGKYVYFHHSKEMDIVSGKILYTVVDMYQNNFKGKVIKKNQVLRGPVKIEGAFTAVKHGNGRDWWIIIPQENVNIYNLYLLTPGGIEGPYPQDLEDSTAALYGKTGWNVVASPDGKKFARVTLSWLPDGQKFNRIFLYDFDRCSGELSNPQVIRVDDPEAYASWAAISPNSRYMYFQMAQTKLYQFDLQAPDIPASKQLIGEYDGFKTPKGFWGTFHAMALAPDNKIYMCCTSGINIYHTIHNPDKPGQACTFRQHDLELPAVNNNLMPNYPNYRLGPLDDSPCDTLDIDNRPQARFRWIQADSLNPYKIEFTDLSYHEPTSWDWYFDDLTVSQDTNPVHEFQGPGVYSVTLTACNPYSCDSWWTDVTIVSTETINPEDPENRINISPNPATEQLNIASRNPVETLMITDATGKVLRRENCSGTQNTVDVSGLSPGLYFVTLGAKGKTWSGKFIKE